MKTHKRPTLVILAGGKGRRLRSITGPDTPKPMADVFGKPFLYWLIKHYKYQGFKKFIISVSYKSDIITDYPWPWRWLLNFRLDNAVYSPELFYSGFPKAPLDNHWVVNGDTFIPEHLPFTNRPTILSDANVDAGAQFVSRGKIQIEPCLKFYDIGTPEGLKTFKKYFKNHPLYIKETSQDK